MEDINLCANGCSYHVRRTDYINVDGCIDLKYFKEAVCLMQKKTNIDTIFVFSDDIGWTKQYFNKNFKENINFIYVSEDESLSNLHELMLMRICRHNIISNSSFSWWGAWIGESIDKIVIAPRVNQWDEEFYPKEWILLNAEIGNQKIVSDKREKLGK